MNIPMLFCENVGDIDYTRDMEDFYNTLGLIFSNMVLPLARMTKAFGCSSFGPVHSTPIVIIDITWLRRKKVEILQDKVSMEERFNVLIGCFYFRFTH